MERRISHCNCNNNGYTQGYYDITEPPLNLLNMNVMSFCKSEKIINYLYKKPSNLIWRFFLLTAIAMYKKSFDFFGFHNRFCYICNVKNYITELSTLNLFFK